MNFAERVLVEVNKAVPLPDEFAEFLFLLLLREEQDKSKYAPNLESDFYAYYLIQILKRINGVHNEGLRVSISELVVISPSSNLNELGFSPSGTFINDLYSYRVPIRFEHSLRKEHTYILGSTGSGKTQLIQQLISQDVESNASIIVIDSQNDLINTLKHSKLIDPERLVIIDPRDSVISPLALNIFDIGQDKITDPVYFESRTNRALELLKYVFSSVIDFGLTAKQQVPFNNCLRLLLLIPGSTLHTFLDILNSGIKDEHWPFVDKMTPSSQQFFRVSFGTSQYNSTRKEISSRLDMLLSTPTLSKIFSSTTNLFDISEAMDSGKVVLISTDRDLLQPSGCSFFGKYFLSLIAQAVQGRATTPQKVRRKCYVYVDECQDYISDNDVIIADILQKSRKYNVGITLANQELGDLSPKILRSVMTNTAIKFVGTCSRSDARQMKSEMRAEDIQMGTLRFMVYTKGSKSSFNIKVKPGIIEDGEQRTNEELEAIMQMNRAKYCVDYEIPDYSPGIPVKEEIIEEKSGIPEDPLAPYT